MHALHTHRVRHSFPQNPPPYSHTSTLQLWLQTFAPNTSTPVHHHDHEEVFWVQHGTGVVKYQHPGSTRVQTRTLEANSTLIVLPHVVHQVMPLW